MSTTSTTRTRRPKWHPTPPPPPSPKILHLPRRIRRKKTNKPPSINHSHHPTNYSHFSDNKKTKLEKLFGQEQHFSDNKKTKLQSLFGQENDISDNKKTRLERLFGQEKEFAGNDNNDDNGDVPVVLLNASYSFSCSDEQRRERVVEDMESDEGLMESGFGEDKWRFQAEILRAECSFLRMEREFAFKKLDRNRKQLERALTSAVQALISGRNKMCERKNGNVEFEKELKELAEKLNELHKSSRAKNVQLRNCHNFDKQACRLQHHLEKLGGQAAFEKSLQENEESCLPTNASDDIDKESDVSKLKNRSKSSDNVKVEVLRRKMEGFSMGMLDRMEEEYGSILTATTNSSVASSASSSMRKDYAQQSGSSTRQMCQEQLLSEENKCSGRCKTLVRRIMDQVRAETEQWSQMQQMLGQIRTEMEQLQVSRDLWEDRALKSEHEIPILQSAVQEWKEKAVNSKAKADALQNELSKLKERLNGKLRMDCGDDEQSNLSSVSIDEHIKAETNSIHLKVTSQTDDNHQQHKRADVSMISVKNSVPLSLGKQLELEHEKRLLRLRLKENRHINTANNRKDDLYDHGRRKTICNDAILESKRTPFRDIGNSSPLTKQYPTVVTGKPNKQKECEERESW